MLWFLVFVCVCVCFALLWACVVVIVVDVHCRLSLSFNLSPCPSLSTKVTCQIWLHLPWGHISTMTRPSCGMASTFPFGIRAGLSARNMIHCVATYPKLLKHYGLYCYFDLKVAVKLNLRVMYSKTAQVVLVENRVPPQALRVSLRSPHDLGSMCLPSQADLVLPRGPPPVEQYVVPIVPPAVPNYGASDFQWSFQD